MRIDWWTLAIQTVNVLILIWLLARFFWRPVASMIEQRRAAVQQDLTDAAAKRKAAEAALAEIDRVRAGFAEEREAILAAAHDTAERARTALLDEAAKQATLLQDAAKEAIEKERHAAEQAWAERASRLAVDIAARLAARLDGAAVRAAFLDWLLDDVRRLPEATRQSIAAGGVPLQATSAEPLDPTEQARCRDLIGAAFGARTEIAFSTDPALIAGLELRGPHLLLSNSWRADLARILAELTHEQ
jgi:F-type H+-transporting ATPase subunit b